MLKASKLVSFCNAMIGQAYWYGTYGNKCTKVLAQKKANQYPDYYADYTTKELQDAIDQKKVCMDCVGLIKAFFWTNGGDGIIAYIKGTGDFNTVYKSNGMPDKSANGLYEWCDYQGAKTGKISTMPDVPGVLVFRSSHVGVYVGDGYVVEAKGHNYGVVKTKFNKSSWVAWAYLPSWMLEYDTKKTGVVQNIVQNVTNAISPAKKYYSKGDNGSKIAKIQKMLVACGYSLGDYEKSGIFDDATEVCLCAFQLDHGLKVDGVYGQETHDALMKAYAQATSKTPASSAQQKSKVVKVTGSRVNVRKEPDQSAKSIGVVKRNAKLEYAGETVNGWRKVVYKKQVAWISADYSDVI